MPPDKIIEKARKLMAMTVENGATEQEAYTAAMRLRELLDKYNLSFASLSKAALKKKVEIEELCYPGGKRKDHAFIELASAVAWGYGSELIISTKGVEFIGVGAAALVAKEMFQYLWDTLNKIAEAQGREKGRKGQKLRSFKHSFILGASEELHYRFYLMNKDKDTIAPEGSFELVRTDCLSEEIEKLYPNLGSYDYDNKKNDIHGFVGGQKAGSKISLNQQIQTEETEKKEIETTLQVKEHLIEAVMDIDKIKEHLKVGDNFEAPFETLQRCCKESGVSFYKLGKLSGVYQGYFSDLEKGIKKDYSIETLIKFAALFELDPIAFPLRYLLHELIDHCSSMDLSSIEPASKYKVTKFFISNDDCEHCKKSFISCFSGRHPEYGDVFQAICPHCSETTKALQSLTIVDEAPEEAVKALKEEVKIGVSDTP